MSAGERHNLVLPSGQNMVLAQGVADAFGGIILDRDGSIRDTTSDTITVATKLDTVAKTLTVAFDTPSTSGKYTVTVTAANLDATGTLYVDVLLAKSGGAAQIIDRIQFTVEDSAAD
jgi:hypothetical protein